MPGGGGSLTDIAKDSDGPVRRESVEPARWSQPALRERILKPKPAPLAVHTVQPGYAR